ncbi:MAG: hypothetical protein U0165_16765 [Polyangiaceae bacterium]
MNRVELIDLVEALEWFDDRYQAMVVFADDLAPLERLHVRATTLTDEHILPTEPSGSFHVDERGAPYTLEVIAQQGTTRLTRSEHATRQGTGSETRSLEVIDAAIACAVSKKGVASGVLLGVLVGPSLNGNLSPKPGEPRRVFTLSFDASQRRWEPYDGGLMAWMKRELV